MSMQPQESPGGQHPYATPPPPPSQRQTENCPGCRAPVQPGQAVCAECGTVLHTQPKPIRCRHCRKEASSAYALCPHCGRGLVAAPSLLFTLGMPAAAVLLLALLLFSQTAGSPLKWAEKQVDKALVVVENPVLTPVRAAGEPPAAGVSAQSDGASSDALTLVAPSDTPTAQPPTDTPQATATPTASPFPTETATPTPTNTPDVTATTIRQSAVASNTQTVTATLTSAATATGRTYTVQEGDTAFSIANRFQVTVADLLTVNQLAPIQALQLKAGTNLEIPGSGPLISAEPTATLTSSPPTATATSTQTATPLPTDTPTLLVQATLPGQQLYTVESGDTFVGIALRFNISTEALLAANGLTITQARDLRPGQKVVIPAAGQSLPPTATPTPGLRRYVVQAGDTIIGIATHNAISTNVLLAVNGLSAAQATSLRAGDELIIPPPSYVLPTVTPTATPRPTVPPTATPTPTAAIRLDAPGQIDPAPGIHMPCSTEQFVRWNPVNGLAPGDEYVLFLGYVNSAPDAAGNVQVVPVLEQRTGQRTNWQMDGAYCNLAPQAFGRTWRWYVQVFNGTIPVSPPSPVWEFTWS